MEHIFLLKQYINDMTTNDAVNLLQEYGTSWLATIIYHLFIALLFNDPSFSIKILPKIKDLNHKIKNIIDSREVSYHTIEGNV